MAYDGKITLKVQLQPQKEVKEQLQSLINQLQKETKIELDFGKGKNTDLKKLYNLDGFVKSAKESAKVFEEMARLDVKIKNASFNSQQKDYYKLLNSLLEEEYSIKTKLITADKQEKAVLDDLLVSVKEKQRLLKEDNKNNSNITNLKEETNLVEKEIKLQNELNIAKAKKADKDNVKQLQEEEKLAERIYNLRSKLKSVEGNGIVDPVVLDELKTKLNSINTDTPVKEIRELEKSINRLASGETPIVRLQNAITKFETSLARMKNNLGDKVIDKKAQSEVQAYEKQLEKLRQMLEKVQANTQSFNGKKVTDELNKMRQASTNLNNALKDNQTLWERIKSTLGNYGIFMTTSMAVSKLFQELKNGIQVVTSVDTAMRDLKRVSDDVSNTTLANFPIKANQLAIELGHTTEGAIQATTTFKQLGYSFEDASNQMAKYSLILSNVGDIDAETSASALVSILKAFKMEAKDTATIVDSLNEAGNKFAITTGDLAEGMRIAGANLAIANNDLYQSEALITAGTEILRDSNKVANGLKTISLRLNEIKTKDGETFLKLDKELKEMANVSIQDMNGELRSTFDIISDLGKKWEKLNDIQRSQILNDVAGKQQANVLASILQNAEKLDDMYTTLSLSAGSAKAEQEAYMDSIEGKVNALKETYKRMWIEAINSDTVKGFVDLLTKLIEVFGRLDVVVGLSATAFAMWKGNAILEAISSLKIFIGAMTSTVAVEGAMTTATWTLGTAFKSLSTIISANPLGFLVMAISASVVALNTLTEKIEESRDYLGKLQEDITGLSEINTTQPLIDQYDKLEEKIKDSSTSTEEAKKAKQQLLLVQQKLAEQFPELIDGYDQEGKAIVRNIEAVKTRINQDRAGMLKQTQSDYQKLIEQMTKSYSYFDAETLAEKIQFGFRKGSKAMINKGEIEYYNELINKVGTLSDVESSRLDQMRDKFKSLNEAVLQLKETGADISGMQMFNFETGQLEDAEEYLARIEEQSINTGDAIADGMENGEDAVKDLDDSLKNLQDTFNGFKSTKDLVGDVIEELQKFGGITEETYGKVIGNADVLKALSQEGDMIANLKQLQDDCTKSMENQIAQAFATANGVSEAYGEEADAKIDSDNTKVQSDTNTNNTIRQNTATTTTVNGQNYAIDEGNFKNATNQKNTAHGNFITNCINAISNWVATSGQNYLNDVLNWFSAIKSKIGAWLGFAKTINATDVSSSVKAGAGSAMKSAISAGTQVAQTAQAQLALSKLNVVDAGNYNVPKMVSGTGGSGGKSGGKSGGSGGKSGKSQAQKEAEKAEEERIKNMEKLLELNEKLNEEYDRYFDYNNNLDLVNNELEKQEALVESLTGKDKIEAENKLVELQKQKIEAIKQVNEERKREANEIGVLLQEQGFEIDSNGKLINSQKRLAELQEDLKHKTYAQSEAGVEAKEKDIEALKKLEEETKRYVELTNKEIPQAIQQYEELEQAIIKARKEKLQSLREQIVEAKKQKYEEEYDKEEKELEEWYEKKKEKLQEQYENDVQDITDEKEIEIDFYDEQIKKLQAELDALNDDSVDKLTKLAKLKHELELWKKDDSVFAKKRIQELEQQIADLEKEIRKDELQDEIDRLKEQQQLKEDSYDEELDDLKDALDDELDELDKKYEKKKKKLKDQYDELLKDKNLYAEADKMITENQMDEIIDLLDDYDESYKEVGQLLGENMKEAFIAEIQDMLDQYKILTQQITGISPSGTDSSNGSTNKNNNSSSSGNSSNSDVVTYGDRVWIDNGATTLIYANKDRTKVLGTAWSQGIASADTTSYHTGGYNNGFWEILDNNNKSLGWVDKRQVKKVRVASASSGGRTPSDIDDGRFMLLHSDEMIANADDTKKFDAIYDLVKVTAEETQRMKRYTGSVSAYDGLQITPQDVLSSRIGNVSNNTSNYSPSISNDITINNYTKDDKYLTEKSLEKLYKEQIERGSKKW